MLTLNQFLHQFQRAFRGCQGHILARMVSLQDDHVANRNLYGADFEPIIENALSNPLDEILNAHFNSVKSLLAKDFAGAYKHQSACISSVIKLLQLQKEENWTLPLMYTVCLDLRLIAQQAERCLGPTQTPGSVLEKAAECLMACFRVCAADNRSSENDTKRLGMLTLVNQLFKVYFQINKLHLCKPLIRAIESSVFKDHFCLSQQITYRYFVGRKAMFDSDYKSADEYLTYAFENCHKKSLKNKRLILIYLVPVKMLLGYMPSKRVLEKYDLLQFWELVEAVKQGNLKQIDSVMDKHESFFIRAGIYLIVEKIKIIAYRNLFRKVYLLENTHQIPVSSLQAALEFTGQGDVGLDETQCIVANLIYDGKIKGYISFQHRKLVVSKQNPFPTLSSLS